MSIKDLIFLISALIIVLSFACGSLLLHKFEIISGHTARKIIHLFSGFTIFFVPYMDSPYLFFIESGSILIIAYIAKSSNFFGFVFNVIAEKDEKEKEFLSGPFNYALSINILLIIFTFDETIRFFYFPACSVMVMMISDTIASYIGKKYGKHEINLKYTKTIRTIEGSLGMFISAFLLSMFGFSFFGIWFPNNTNFFNFIEILILSFIVAINSTIIEILSPSNIDDLTVPITGCLCSFGIAILLFPSAIGL